MVLTKYRAVANELGFENLSIFSAGNAARAPEFLTTYPRKWNERYMSERYYLVDPVVSRGRHRPGPIAWGGRDYLHRAVHEGRRMLLEAREFGVRSAYSVPFFCADGRYNLITFSSNLARDTFDKLLDSHEAEAIHVALYAHLDLTRVEGAAAEKAYKLTDRQKCCLRMVLDGRTNAEMARLLSISEATVRFHLTAAVRKTHARNSAHAAFLAHQVSLL